MMNEFLYLYEICERNLGTGVLQVHHDQTRWVVCWTGSNKYSTWTSDVTLRGAVRSMIARVDTSEDEDTVETPWSA